MKKPIILVAAMFVFSGCEFESFESEYGMGEGNATVEPSASEPEVVEEEEEVEATPVANVPTDLTNADLLAMDTVVITAVVAADNSVQYYSDVGSKAVTTATTIRNLDQLNTPLSANAPLEVNAGMKIVFCNHPQSDAGSNQLRIHAGATSAFNHWGGGQGLARGECSFNLGYPEDVEATAVNNTPGNNLYNHNGPQNSSRIFISVK